MVRWTCVLTAFTFASLVNGQGSGLTVHTQEGDVTAPQPAPKRSTVFKATQFGNSCLQSLPPDTIGYLELTGQRGLDVAESEDCLTLNIWSPAVGRKQNTAVLVWIYGGGFSFGTSNLAVYQGENMIRDNDDITLVTFNYRLNIFGQPGAPQLANSTQPQNFGLLDIDAAIQWVHANIESFGGDPNRITIFGQSAGSLAADVYAFSHPNDTIVKGTISGGPSFENTIPSNGSTWTTVATSVGCGPTPNSAQFDCMKSTPARVLGDAILSTGSSFMPLIVDEITFFSDPDKRSADGNFLRVPMLGGSTLNEMDVFLVAQQLVAKGFTVPVITEIVSDATTQMVLTCPAGGAAITRNNFDVPTWRYQYQAIFPDLSTRPDLRCYHASEIPMVFGTFTAPFPNISSTPEEVALSKYIQSAWVAFARDPQKGLLEFGWPMYNPNTTSLVEIGNPANVTGAVFGSGSLLDTSCSDMGMLSSVAGMLSGLLPGK
ncbi:carboxylesterase [Cyathus striatus]|nr:carboxylesterase [Cyathus striatus]